MNFTITKVAPNNFTHFDGFKEMKFSNWEMNFNETDNTIILQMRNGAPFPKKEVKAVDVIIKNGVDGTSETFSTTEQIYDRLVELSYNPLAIIGRWGFIGGNIEDQTDLKNILDNLQLQIDGLTGIFYGSAQPTDTPSGVEDGYWIATENGTYTNFGGIVVNPNSLAVISRISGVFSISQTEIELSDYLKSKYLLEGVNLYNELNDLPNFYLNSTIGAFYPIANPDYVVSEISPVVEGQRIYMVNWDRNESFCIRFVDASENPLKPLQSDGITPLPLYSTVFADYIIAPIGAVGVQYTTKFNGYGDQSNLIVNDTGALTETIRANFIPEDKKNPLSVKIEGENINILTKTENGNLVEFVNEIRTSATTESNSNLSFLYTRVNGIELKQTGDDICPANIVSAGYIAGNHGWSAGRNILKIGHNKTFADIGAVYTDSTSRQFVIIRIVDADNLIMVALNDAVDGYSIYFGNPTGTLTYTSNGVDTTAISGYTFSFIASIYNFSIENNLKFFIDDKEFTEGLFYGKEFKILENTDFLDISDFALKITAQRPIGGYLANPDFRTLNVDKLFNHSIVYAYSKGGKCTVSHSFTNYKKLHLNFHGFIQASPVNTGLGFIYVPKSLPFDAGNKIYSLNELTVYDTPTNDILLDSTYWEYPTNPPDRILNYNGDFGFHLGYIKDLGDSVNRKDLVDNSIFISTNRKLYPMGVSVPTVMDAYSSFSVVAFRNVVDLSNNGIRSNYDLVKVGNSYYVYLDYHNSGLDIIPISSELSAMDIEVIESKNTTLLSKVGIESLSVKSTATTSNNGFLVLKFR